MDNGAITFLIKIRIIKRMNKQTNKNLAIINQKQKGKNEAIKCFRSV